MYLIHGIPTVLPGFHEVFYKKKIKKIIYEIQGSLSKFHELNIYIYI